MIVNAMRLIRAALERYIQEFEQESPGEEPPRVVINNIALAKKLGGDDEDIQGVIMSLVNLQEEATLKNVPHYRLDNGRSIYQNPPVHLNLFILFSVLDSNYQFAIKLLSRVVEFFQIQKELSFTSTPPQNLAAVGGSIIPQEVKIVADLYSLTFEQLNHLWGALGGKQVPFVLYRVRLVAVQGQKRQAEGEVITEIFINE